MQFLNCFLVALLLSALSSLSAQASAGVWFCNFYPSTNPMAVYNKNIAGNSFSVVAYQQCNYLPNYATVGALITLTAALQGQSTVANATYTSFAAQFAQGGTAAAGTLDMDNQNIVVAYSSSGVQNTGAILFQGYTPQTVASGGFPPNNFFGTTQVRSIVANFVPNPLQQTSALATQYAGNGANLDCSEVGPPANGVANNDMTFLSPGGTPVTFNNAGGQIKLRDAPATPTSTANDQAFICYPADNTQGNGNIFGGVMTWWQASHPADTVTLSGYMGNGSPQFPVTAMTYAFSATSIANAIGAQGNPAAGTMPYFFTPNQLQACQQSLKTCFM